MNKTLKLKGRTLFLEGQEVASVAGCREWTNWGVVSNFAVVVSGDIVANGFCYFADAVKWARQNVPAVLVGEERQ